MSSFGSAGSGSGLCGQDQRSQTPACDLLVYVFHSNNKGTEPGAKTHLPLAVVTISWSWKYQLHTLVCGVTRILPSLFCAATAHKGRCLLRNNRRANGCYNDPPTVA